MHFLPPDELAERAAATYAGERRRVLALLPEADVEQIGGTAIPGAWSKGDVDLLVRVEAAELAAATAALRRAYDEHQRENWNETFASFAARGGEPVGVQLVARGSADDRAFRRFRDRVAAEPELLAEYNELKRRQEGAAEDVYRAAKAAFVARVVG